MKIFIKNLDENINELWLEALLTKFGKVISTKVIYDKITWESRGFAFVEMEKEEDAQKAIKTLNGKKLRGQELIVTEAEERGK